MEIKNVIICGLGALGLTYANKLKNVCNLKILANFERIENYKKNTPSLNNEKLLLDYITPDESFKTDLIIISTKSMGLDSAIEYIKNFVSDNTIIISLINGISSEKRISNVYPDAKVLRSFFIGHSAMGVNVNGKKDYYQDGIGKIVFEPNIDLENFFKKNNIDYEISKDIIYSQWIKLGVNIILNEPSAIYKCTVGELRKKKGYWTLVQKLLNEVSSVADACGIKELENYKQEVLKSANLIADDGKTSMYQDVITRRKTEVDIFSGEIIRLGKLNNIETPVNQEIYDQIKKIESNW